MNNYKITVKYNRDVAENNKYNESGLFTEEKKYDHAYHYVRFGLYFEKDNSSLKDVYEQMSLKTLRFYTEYKNSFLNYIKQVVNNKNEEKFSDEILDIINKNIIKVKAEVRIIKKNQSEIKAKFFIVKEEKYPDILIQFLKFNKNLEELDEHIQNKYKPNLFERTFKKLSNSKDKVYKEVLLEQYLETNSMAKKHILEDPLNAKNWCNVEKWIDFNKQKTSKHNKITEFNEIFSLENKPEQTL